MKMIYRRTFQLAAPQRFVILGLLTVNLGMSQTAPQSPSQAIRFLTYQSDRTEKLVVMMGMEGCGYFEQNRTAAQALVKFGASAIPDLERALDSLDERG